MVTMQQTLGDDWHALCRSTDLENGGLAVPFDIVYQGQTCPPLPFVFRMR